MPNMIKNLLLSIVFLFFNNNFLHAQNSVITGTVTDFETGATLPGVSVTIKGSAIGVSTDKDGKFRIIVNTPSAVLVFSYTGYLKIEEPANGRKKHCCTTENRC